MTSCSLEDERIEVRDIKKVIETATQRQARPDTRVTEVWRGRPVSAGEEQSNSDKENEPLSTTEALRWSTGPGDDRQLRNSSHL